MRLFRQEPTKNEPFSRRNATFPIRKVLSTGGNAPFTVRNVAFLGGGNMPSTGKNEVLATENGTYAVDGRPETKCFAERFIEESRVCGETPEAIRGKRLRDGVESFNRS